MISRRPTWRAGGSISQYLYRVHVKLMKPLADADTPGEFFTGYFWVVGVSAPTDRGARDLINREVADGAIDWADSELAAVGLTSIPDEILTVAQDPTALGIWYRSGRVFY